jgi:sulfur transfer complex TusBCD TusB component (DsrH family)
MKTLNIVESAYRATIEEQDDTVVWLMHAMKGAGATLDVVLRGDAVACAVRGQDAGGLAFGDWRQTEPPHVEQQLAGLAAKGVTLYALADDLAARGIVAADLLPGVEPLQLPALAALLPRYDRVWHW